MAVPRGVNCHCRVHPCNEGWRQWQWEGGGVPKWRWGSMADTPTLVLEGPAVAGGTWCWRDGGWRGGRWQSRGSCCLLEPWGYWLNCNSSPTGFYVSTWIAKDKLMIGSESIGSLGKIFIRGLSQQKKKKKKKNGQWWSLFYCGSLLST